MKKKLWILPILACCGLLAMTTACKHHDKDGRVMSKKDTRSVTVSKTHKGHGNHKAKKYSTEVTADVK